MWLLVGSVFLAFARFAVISAVCSVGGLPLGVACGAMAVHCLGTFSV